MKTIETLTSAQCARNFVEYFTASPRVNAPLLWEHEDYMISARPCWQYAGGSWDARKQAYCSRQERTGGAVITANIKDTKYRLRTRKSEFRARRWDDPSFVSRALARAERWAREQVTLRNYREQIEKAFEKVDLSETQIEELVRVQEAAGLSSVYADMDREACEKWIEILKKLQQKKGAA